MRRMGSRRSTMFAVAVLITALSQAAPMVVEESVSARSLLRVQVVAPAAPAILDQLHEAGAVYLGHLAPDTVLLAASPGTVQRVEGVVEVSPWSSEQAIVSELLELSQAEAKAFGAGVPVVLGFVPGTALQPVAAQLSSSGAEVTWSANEAGKAQLGLLVPDHRWVDVLHQLQEMPGLVFADLQPPVRLRNGDSTWRCQSGLASSTPVFDRGLHGEGQVVGIMDTGIDADMCYFADQELGLPPVNDQFGTAVDLEQRKVLAVDFYWSADWPSPTVLRWDDHGHGTHVAGSVAGDDGGDARHQGVDGMAPAARLVIQDGGYEYNSCADLPGIGCPVQPLEPMLQQAYDQGARLHSNSWGDEEEYWPPNRYTERTADVDRFSWNHKDFLVFFAAGNGGGLGNDTVGSPATGKNVVAVGATTHGEVEPPCPAGFSSRGWTEDGRIKPDVMAPGHQVVSALSDHFIGSANCTTAAFSGTSMACPTAAGLGALVRQYFAQGFYPQGTAGSGLGFEPTGALVKATLIAAAVDLRELGCTSVARVPSRDQGWGLVILDRALHFPGDEERLLVDDHREGFVSAGDAPVQYQLVTRGSAPLKVVLVWTDPPSNSAAAKNLINDLDLEVEGEVDGFPTTYLGNVFSDGVSVPYPMPDRRNNVEVVWLPQAPSAAWTITVRPSMIGMAPQDFALVVVGDLSPDRVRNLRNGGRISP